MQAHPKAHHDQSSELPPHGLKRQARHPRRVHVLRRHRRDYLGDRVGGDVRPARRACKAAVHGRRTRALLIGDGEGSGEAR